MGILGEMIMQVPCDNGMAVWYCKDPAVAKSYDLDQIIGKSLG